MRYIYSYILLLLTAVFSCQRVELPEETKHTDALSKGSVSVTFSAILPDSDKPNTKVLVDPTDDITSLHLVVFNEEGMLVEYATTVF